MTSRTIVKTATPPPAPSFQPEPPRTSFLNPDDCATVLVDELRQLAAKDPESFSHYSYFDQIERKLASAAVRTAPGISREVAPVKKRSHPLYATTTCRIMVRGMVEIMDSAARNLSQLPIRHSDNETVDKIISRQLDVIKHAGFIVLRMLTQTPNSLNDAEMRELIHAAVMRKMREPLEPMVETPGEDSGAPRLTQAFEGGKSTAVEVTGRAGFPVVRQDNKLSYAESIRDLAGLEIVASYMLLSNEPVMQVITNIQGKDLGPRIHGHLQPRLFEQFDEVLAVANVLQAEGLKRQNEFESRRALERHPLALSQASLYVRVCYSLGFSLVDRMKEMLDVAMKFREAQARAAEPASEPLPRTAATTLPASARKAPGEHGL